MGVAEVGDLARRINGFGEYFTQFIFVSKEIGQFNVFSIDPVPLCLVAQLGAVIQGQFDRQNIPDFFCPGIFEERLGT